MWLKGMRQIIRSGGLQFRDIKPLQPYQVLVQLCRGSSERTKTRLAEIVLAIFCSSEYGMKVMGERLQRATM